MNQPLPTPLPASPWNLFEAWLEQATSGAVQPNPNAMTVATVDADGMPSVRVVLLKALVSDPGYVVFYTNYESRKGRAIAADPRVACCLHWDPLGRQVRIEGLAVASPPAESDAYFATRDPASQLGAWGSDQSRPLASRDALVAQTLGRARDLGLGEHSTLEGIEPPAGGLPRPPHWGGFRVWPRAIELWIEGPARIHDRARWERTLAADGDGEFRTGPWRAQRLQP
jgi:pyridoxamine 5'-phosphate oxidase